MRKVVGIILLLITTFYLHAQSPIGKWKSVDDETGETESVIEIYKNQDGLLDGKIIELLVVPENENCVKCKGELKDQPLIGLTIIQDMAQKGNRYAGGSIVDPKTGSQYKCILQVMDDGRLKVRGFLGIEALGRTQYWYKEQ